MNGCFRSTFGILIAVPSFLMALLALGLLFSGETGLRGFGVVLGIIAAVGLVIAVRRFRPTKNKSSDVATAPAQTPFAGTAASAKKRSKRKYEDVAWGNPPPTVRQFGYALSLGVNVADGMTKDSISEEIDRALGNREPATEEQLRLIAKLHGVLPRQVTKTEAGDVIEFLEDHDFNCPFCGETIYAGDATGSCISCRKSLKEVRIPIEIPKR